MTTINLKGINKTTKRLANGEEKVFFYHRATGTRLPGHPGSPDFLEAYKQAEQPFAHDTGTIAALIREYLKSPQFTVSEQSSRNRSRKRGVRPLKDRTKKEYKRMLTILEKKVGDMRMAALASPRVMGKFIDYQEEIGTVSPREADNRLTILSGVFSYAKLKGRIARNPLLGFQRCYESDRSDLIWLEDDITTFMEEAPIELQRALILAIHTGQRYDDLLRLRWSDYDGSHIRLKQSKTDTRVTVKVTGALKRMLDATPKTCFFILARANGRPWPTAKDNKRLAKEWDTRMKATPISSYNYLADTRKDADTDLKGERLHFNDLRGTAVTLLAEAGCTVPEIASITGHSFESADRILKKYLARTQKISDAAILKFENSPATAFANRLQTASIAKS